MVGKSFHPGFLLAATIAMCLLGCKAEPPAATSAQAKILFQATNAQPDVDFAQQALSDSILTELAVEFGDALSDLGQPQDTSVPIREFLTANLKVEDIGRAGGVYALGVQNKNRSIQSAILKRWLEKVADASKPKMVGPSGKTVEEKKAELSKLQKQLAANRSTIQPQAVKGNDEDNSDYITLAESSAETDASSEEFSIADVRSEAAAWATLNNELPSIAESEGFDVAQALSLVEAFDLQSKSSERDPNQEHEALRKLRIALSECRAESPIERAQRLGGNPVETPSDVDAMQQARAKLERLKVRNYGERHPAYLAVLAAIEDLEKSNTTASTQDSGSLDFVSAKATTLDLEHLTAFVGDRAKESATRLSFLETMDKVEVAFEQVEAESVDRNRKLEDAIAGLEAELRTLENIGVPEKPFRFTVLEVPPALDIPKSEQARYKRLRARHPSLPELTFAE